uniref:hypothetical protein n=1 Tax=Bacillus multifaciens TaxID=3068506 RepID=UPI003F490849
MNPFKDKQLPYWLVNLGSMYYAGGLIRKKDNESTFSYEFVNDESYAFPFLEKYGAERIAEKCGGIILDKTATSDELMILENNNDKYIHSESKAKLEQELTAWEEIKKEKEKLEDINVLESELEQLNPSKN